MLEIPDLLARIASQTPLSGRLVAASLELALAAALASLAVRLLPLRLRRLRSMIWLLVLVKPLLTLTLGPALPVVSLSSGRADLASQSRSLETVLVKDGDFQNRKSPASAYCLGDLGPRQGEGNGLTSWPGLPLALWMAGVAVGLAFFCWTRLRLAGMIRAGHPAPEAVTALYQEVAHRLGLRRPPLLRVCDEIASPALIGSLAPKVVLPGWMVEEGNREKLEWSLRHELTHLKFRDPWAALAGELCRIFFFFHPLAWLVSRQWRRSAELACDQALVSCRSEALRYAEVLYGALKRIHTRPALAASLYATRTQMGRRIETLLNRHFDPAPRRAGGSLALLALFAGATLLAGVEIVAPAPAWLSRDFEKNFETGQPFSASTLSLPDQALDRDGLLLFKIQGEVTFDQAGRISAMAPGSRLDLEEESNGRQHRLAVQPDAQGMPSFKYSIDGQSQDFDQKALAWSQRMLGRALRPQ